MLYLIHGSDTKKTQSKFSELIKSLKAKRPDALVVTLADEEDGAERLAELAVSSTLFDARYLVTCRRLMEDSDVADFVKREMEVLAGSPNVFIMLEEDLSNDVTKKFKKYADKVEEHNKSVSTQMEEEREYKRAGRELFALTDKLGVKDKRGLWLGFTSAIEGGHSAEEIFWKFVWATKAMLLARASSSAASAGLNPFVYEKAKKHSANYGQNELGELSGSFIEMYHDHNRGGLELVLALENLILRV